MNSPIEIINAEKLAQEELRQDLGDEELRVTFEELLNYTPEECQKIANSRIEKRMNEGRANSGGIYGYDMDMGSDLIY